jgi:hypothetical protein
VLVAVCVPVTPGLSGKAVVCRTKNSHFVVCSSIRSWNLGVSSCSLRLVAMFVKTASWFLEWNRGNPLYLKRMYILESG